MFRSKKSRQIVTMVIALILIAAMVLSFVLAAAV
jgi:hypothetical protein